MSPGTLLGIRGFLVDAPEYGRLRSWPDGAIVIADGKIAEIGRYDQLRKLSRPREIRWVDSPNRLIFPGFIDLHTHLPQYPAVARGESGLLPWLRQYIFPIEREFTGKKAQQECKLFFQDLARHGTTTAMVYSAIFEDSCDAAFQAAKQVGLRLILGKMMMDVGSYGNHQPRKVASISSLESEKLCQKWNGENNGLLEYAFSPRFAVSCSEKMMRNAAELAQKYDAYIQTHLSENREEIEKVRNLFMWSESYTDVYDKCGLLGPKTILGHCIHLDDKEIAIVAERGAKIAHCPTSNLFLGSGIMPLDRLRKAGIVIGLGSDVAAGPEINMCQVMRSAVESQKVRSFYEADVDAFGPVEAFHLATQGGADALGKSEKLGSFDIGKDADLVVMDIPSLLPYGRKHKASTEERSAEDLIALLVYRGGASAVLDTYVAGQPVHQSISKELFA